LESFTKDALSITKMIDERERMMHHRSRSMASTPERSRRASFDHRHHEKNNNDDDDDADYDDDDFNESDSSVTRILKRRMRKKKKQQNKNQSNQDDDDDNQNFDNLRRRLSSATMTSADEDDYLACSFKTVIHRPKAADVPLEPQPQPPPHFYLAPTDNPPQPSTQSEIMALTPPPLIPALPAPLPVLVLPSPPVNLPMHHRAHTDTDLLFYNQQPLLYPVHWYPPPAFIYPNPSTPPANFVYGPLPSFVMQPIPQQHQQQVRSSSADCRRTANNGNEHRVIHPERVW
jgi:hypothetical protein